MVNVKSQKIVINNTNIVFFTQNDEDYISLTDIAKYKNREHTGLVISHWLRTKYTIEFMGLWEKIHNKNFNVTEFGYIKNEVGSNTFVLTGKQWISKTGSIGLISKPGRFGGTFAHKDIAFEFASWISAEFKLYLIKEFQRLKGKENSHQNLEWNAKRFLVRANYKVHTDAVQQNLIPSQITRYQATAIYASEADVLNMALFSMTAKQWREKNPKIKGNIRDDADITQLVCLAGLESLNAEFIRQGLKQNKRLERLNQIAIIQMKALVGYSPSRSSLRLMQES